MNNLENLLKILPRDYFTHENHNQDNSILEFFDPYIIKRYFDDSHITILGVAFVPHHYSHPQIGIMFEDKEFDKWWIHVPMELYKDVILDKFKNKAEEFLDKCKKMWIWGIENE